MSITHICTSGQPPAGASDDALTIRVSVNRYFNYKISKDAPTKIWDAFNASFEWCTVTLAELAELIHLGFAITAICR